LLSAPCGQTLTIDSAENHNFDVQGSLFESLGSIAPGLFDDKDQYKLFARKVWPLLASRREELAQCDETDRRRRAARSRATGVARLRRANSDPYVPLISITTSQDATLFSNRLAKSAGNNLYRCR
jgi:hypothetical protein